MRMESAHNDEAQLQESSLAASGALINAFNDSSSPSPKPQHNPPRFDDYTDPVVAFSANNNNRKKRRIENINNYRCNFGHSPNGQATDFNRPRMISPLSNQSSPVNNAALINSYAQQQPPIWQPNFHSEDPQPPVTLFRSSVLGHDSPRRLSVPQRDTRLFEFSNSSNGNPMTLSPVPRFKQTPSQDSFGSQLPRLQQQKQQCWSHPRQFSVPGYQRNPLSEVSRSLGCIGKPWFDFPGSSNPGLSVGGREMSLSDAKGRSGGRGASPWMNPRIKCARGLRGNLGPNRGRGGRAHVSALERPDLFFKKSMVENPWKNLKPVIMAIEQPLKPEEL